MKEKCKVVQHVLDNKSQVLYSVINFVNQNGRKKLNTSVSPLRYCITTRTYLQGRTLLAMTGCLRHKSSGCGNEAGNPQWGNKCSSIPLLLKAQTTAS